MSQGRQAAIYFKKNILGAYARLFQRIDAPLAEHLLRSQRELFLAGQRFFEEEVRHADKALAKIAQRTEGERDKQPPSI